MKNPSKEYPENKGLRTFLKKDFQFFGKRSIH